MSPNPTDKWVKHPYTVPLLPINRDSIQKTCFISLILQKGGGVTNTVLVLFYLLGTVCIGSPCTVRNHMAALTIAAD